MNASKPGASRQGREVRQGWDGHCLNFLASPCALCARPSASKSSRSGFALVITVVLLALLVLVVFALSTLSRVGAEVAATGNQQVQARQHALLGLSQAVGALQRYAAEDDVLTGIAGLTGIPSGPNQPARHWCGVWDRDGDFFRWLVPGADTAPGLLSAGGSVPLVAGGSTGNFDSEDREHVRVPLLPVLLNTRAQPGVRLGAHAWWVGDEGVKLSLAVPAEMAPVDGGRHAVAALLTQSPLPAEAVLDRLLAYEQLDVTGVVANDRRRNLHVLGVTHLSHTGPAPVAGRLNINTNARRFWLGMAETYNGLRPDGAPAISSPAAFAALMSSGFFAADPGAGKAQGGPFPSVDLFLNSQVLTQALSGTGGLLLSFGDVMRPWLTVRSDTFRVRAYGEAVNPAEPGRIEAAAWCEAVVQRVKDDPAATSGRFVITYFRWLGADDI